MDAKWLLQVVARRAFGDTPRYFVLDELGPDHCKCFKAAAQLGDKRFPAAWGTSKADVEQKAAKNALAHIYGDPIPYPAE
ncbi:putative dsRNA-binding protein [Frigoriglobus tundricola]|uniref:Ribonuclease III n=1 Tax=Frigoriglobus tundricola TaxID=2774151 RepID=A0A6M5YSC9_9BACT|nr:putative dsRNA-binding protein [Frigoriglobus tundricola]QJW96789.1 Ribonuclease III [Frigoriglobus tundricola]